jgi:hypothetical protein
MHSALKMTERFRRPFGTLEIDVTIDDEAYTKFTVRVNQRIMVDQGDDRVHLQRTGSPRTTSRSQ